MARKIKVKKHNLPILAVGLMAGVNEGLAYLDVIPKGLLPDWVKGSLLISALVLKIVLPLINTENEGEK